MRKLILALGCWGLLASPAWAQTSNAGAIAGSAADSAADARAGSAAVIQQTFQAAPGTTRNIVGYEGEYRQNYRATIRNTPDAYAPNVSGGTNSCLVGMSGAGSVAGFGIGIGGNWSDRDCERRQLAALAHNTGQQALAQEVLCGSTDIREARRRMGQPCLVDLPPGSPPPQVAARPVILAGAPATPTGNDWCGTVSMADARNVRATCGWTGPNNTRRPGR